MAEALKFEQAYKGLNPAQREAVEALDGPVMVVAGPGTGKTQVLALRIAHILKETDTPPSGILCLTFTNAGVHAMRERLLRLIGSRGNEVHVSTFHRFAIGLIEKYYSFLDFDQQPELLADAEAIGLADEILENGEWLHIRPRGDSAKYFGDLKSLISLLKRENISSENFLAEVEREIESLKSDPESVSSRGARKGELKREVESRIESLERTREVVRFYDEYERLKFERGQMDYDDVLSYAVQLAERSEDARAFVRENYLYVLVDEHQDSSGVQNAFLEAVWGGTERPNIFVVGDDRQLIYGFGGASLEQFTNFRRLFGKAREITLIENYRSTQTILDAADALLVSSLANGKLHSNSGASEEKIVIRECDYPRDEIIALADDLKKRFAEGLAPEDCALLVPKNYQARIAAGILRDQGIPVASGGTLSFFAQPETLTIRRILSVLADPYDSASLGGLLLDPVIGISPLAAHRFLRANARRVSLDTLVVQQDADEAIARFAGQMGVWLDRMQSLGLHGLVQQIGEDLFFAAPVDHDALIARIEIIRTYLHLLSAQMEKHPHLSLAEFVAYLDRLEQYGHEIPLATFSGKGGVRILTLHGSKGLEFSYVHIAHLDQGSLMKGRRMGFTLPERTDALVHVKDELVARRELYVAVTRAKVACTLSYARHAATGAALEPASIIADFPEELIERQSAAETEARLLATDPKLYVSRNIEEKHTTLAELAAVVKEEYAKTNVSVTLLNNFFECPWKWYFRSLLQLPEPKTESLLLGSAVHSGIEYMLKNRGSETEHGVTAVLENCLEREYVCDEALIKRTLREAKKILARFTETYLPHIREDALSERSVSYRDPKFPHLTCYGKIDLTEREDDAVVTVTDFKTGSGKSKSVVEKRDEEGRLSSLLRQLAMYSYLIQNAEKGVSVSLSKLLFLEESPKDKDAVYATTITDEEIGLLKKDIVEYDELIQSGEWVSRPCAAKSYGKNEVCEYCARAKALYI